MVIFNGFKFGILLQVAIGPIVLMALKISGSLGLIQGFIFVGATVLVDAFYIFLAGIGVSKLLEKDNVQRILKYFGNIVLILFGINIILGIFYISILPNMKIQKINIIENVFIQGLIINLSNPLVIIFWGGVFSGKTINEKYTKKEILIFGTGCLLSTIIFFGIIVIIGNFIKILFSPIMLSTLNGIVGLYLIIIGIKNMVQKNGERPYVA
jgi:threonine/homoserine/homoserine lactone efflux protein